MRLLVVHGDGLELTLWAVNEVPPLQNVVFSGGIASVRVALIWELVIIKLGSQILFTHDARSSPTTRRWEILLVVLSSQ